MSPYGKPKTYHVCAWLEGGKVLAVLGRLEAAPWPGSVEYEVEAASAHEAKRQARRMRAEFERAREGAK
jgi:hypothetical protein